MTPIRFVIVVIVLGLVASFATPNTLALSFPEKPPTSEFFVDEASLLDESARATINSTALALLQEQQIPIFVVTISSLSSHDASKESIESYATKLFDHWGIGSQARNYGLLLLVSVGDRRARIELGAGFEHRYDAEAKDIMQSLIVPAFRRDDYSTGITDGVRGMDAMARGLQLPKPTAPWWFLPLMLGGVVFLGFAIYNLFKTGRSGWAWVLIVATGTFVYFVLRSAMSSSSGGFGGGSSGGGGASGSW